MITPELTQSMLEAVAPELKDIINAAHQASSVAPMTPEIENILEGGPGSPAPEPSAETPAPEAPPTSAAPEEEPEVPTP
jgi:hypothetical protein